MPYGDGSDATAAGMTIVLGSEQLNTVDTAITRAMDYLANGPQFWKPGVVVPVTKGGTGATDAAGARAALGVIEAAQVVRSGSAGSNMITLTWSGSRLRMTIDATTIGDIANTGDLAARVDKAGDTMSGHLFLPAAVAATSGYTIAYINGDGRVSKGASSERFKDDITPIDPASLGDLFPQLHTFVMKDDPGRMQRVGYIAERLNESDDLRSFVVYAREPEYQDVLEDVVEDVYNEDGEFVEAVVVGQRVVGQQVIGSHVAVDDAGKPIPESIDFIGLLLAQVAQLHERVAQLEAAK